MRRRGEERRRSRRFLRKRHCLVGTTVVVALVAVAVAGCGGSAHTPHRASGAVVGVMFDGPVFAGDVNLESQMQLAVASGVNSLRVAVDWARAQPYRSLADVPAAQRSEFVDAGGVPTRFAQLDRVVGAAAARGLSVLPVIEYAPTWDAKHPGDPASPPSSLGPFAAFLTALVHRYGPSGTYWSAHPRTQRVAVRMWQIWNEPHFVSYWSEQPFAPSYVKLLAAARAALNAADPGARVVLGGLADFSWRYLAQIYREPGARRLFDVVAIHPYTAQPEGVIVILQRVRAVMNQFGDRSKPILATEITWPSSEGKAPPQFGVSTTESQQARRLGRVMPLLNSNRARLGLAGFYWYTWMGDETPGAAPYAFNYAGLLKYVRGAVSAKPALGVFRHWALAIESCRPTTMPCRPA